MYPYITVLVTSPDLTAATSSKTHKAITDACLASLAMIRFVSDMSDWVERTRPSWQYSWLRGWLSVLLCCCQHRG
jgi:hypothetical protein